MSKIFTKEENRAWSKALPGKMCSACIALRSSNQVLMVKAVYKNHWTFPSGIVDTSESPKSAALRETFEEIGIKIKDENCELLAVIYTAANGDDRDRFNFTFISDIPSQEIKLLVPNDEIERAEWVNFNEVAKRAGNRGSYIKLQETLLDNYQDHYMEVHTVENISLC